MSRKFRKKPVEIEAVQFDGSNHREVLVFMDPSMNENSAAVSQSMQLPLVIQTLEGRMRVSVGDWVIRGVKGELYPCKDDIFRMTYEPVDEATS